MSQNQVIYRDPKSLRLHKLRRNFPAINKEAPDWIALTDSVCAQGILQALLITAEGFIVDGGWRWEAAKDWQCAEVPCQIVPEEMAGVIIAETLLARKQMNRGAAVYLMMPIAKDVVMSAEFRRLENVKKNRKTNEIELKPQHFSMSSNWTSPAEQDSIRALCFRWGVGKTTFYQAKNIWLWLNEGEFAALKKLHTEMELPVPSAADLRNLQEDLREDFEHQLLIGEKNLWNVESGIKGRLTGGAHEPPQQQLELFGDALDSLATRAARFATPDKAAPEIRKWIAATESEMNLKGLSDEEVIAKMEAVAATCDVTRKTIQEWLKQRATAAK